MKRTERRVEIHDVMAAYQAIVDGANNAQDNILSQFEKIYESKFKSLERELKHLNINARAAAEDVGELEKKVAIAESVWKNIERTVRRRKKRPVLTEGDWLVHGRILESKGGVGVGLRVNVFDKERKYDKQLGQSVTDEYGGFCLLYHSPDLEELIEQKLDIFLEVIDKKDQVVYESEKSIHWKSNHIDYFDIRIGGGPSCSKS